MRLQLVHSKHDPEVLRIKRLLEDRRMEPGTRLCESLWLLHLLKIPEIKKLQSTNVISVVTRMRESNMRRTRDLAVILVRGWRKLTNEWMNEDSPESAPIDRLPVNEEDLSFLRSLPFPPPHGMEKTSSDDNNPEDLQETSHIRNAEAKETFQSRGKLKIRIKAKERGVHDVRNLAINRPKESVGHLHRKPATKKFDDLQEIPNIRNAEAQENIQSRGKLIIKLKVKQRKVDDVRNLAINHPAKSVGPQHTTKKLDVLQVTPDIRNAEGQEKLQSRGKLTIKTEGKERKLDDARNLAFNHPRKCVDPLHGKPAVEKLDDREYEQKLALSKRKLQEGYQDAENEKKKHRSMLLDFKDLPTSQQREKNPDVRHGCRINMRPKHAYRPMVW